MHLYTAICPRQLIMDTQCAPMYSSGPVEVNLILENVYSVEGSICPMAMENVYALAYS